MIKINETALDNYRGKSTDDLRDTFKYMNEAALSSIWVNFDEREWLSCAYAMLKVIEERGGFKKESRYEIEESQND